MIVLKQIIYDIPTNSVEANWVDIQPLPDMVIPAVPAIPAIYNLDGELVQKGVLEVPEKIITNRTKETQIKCHSYADCQMQMLRDHAEELETPLTTYEDLISLVESNIKPPSPSLELSYAELRAAEYPSIADQLDAIWKGGADADNMKAKILDIKARYPEPENKEKESNNVTA